MIPERERDRSIWKNITQMPERICCFRCDCQVAGDN
jgi:hypothetical protein